MVTSLGRTLVHVIEPRRRPAPSDDIDLIPEGASATEIGDRLDGAALLVVDDALAFPFEAFGALDVPLAVRVPYPLDPEALESVLGADLLDHLTSLDVVAGPLPALGAALRRRRLPRSRVVGGPELTLQQLVNRARGWRRRLDARWRPWPTPPGTPLDVVALQVPPGQAAVRLRHAKARLACELPTVRRELHAAAERLPRTRRARAIVAAAAPEVWATALPPAVETWTAVPLVGAEDHDDDLDDPGIDVIPVPGHLRLSLRTGDVDLAVVAADMLHGPLHGVERLLHEVLRSLRPGGTLVLLAEVVPDPARDEDRRPEPLSARETVELVSRASGRQAVLESVQAIRRPGEDLHRSAMFRWTQLGTARKETPWR